MVDPAAYRGAKEYLARGADRTRKYNTIKEGDVLQVLVSLSDGKIEVLLSRSGVHVLSTSANGATRTFWTVIGVYKAEGCPFVYAHVMALRPCANNGSSTSSNLPASGSMEPLYALNLARATF